jgi:hypothetical protein
MHPISDKELDKLFQQRFEDFQVEPSNQVWENIYNTLDKKKPAKKTFSIFWMAAASVVLVLSAGLWFSNLQETNIVQENTEIASKNTDELIQLPQNENIELPVKEVAQQSVRIIQAYEDIALIHPNHLEVPINETIDMIPVSKPEEKDVLVILASNDTKKPILNQPKTDVKVPERYAGDQSALDLSRPDLTASQNTQSSYNQDNNDSSDRGKKVKGIGALVNFVIAQVDKREDKLIEFTESDEGNKVSGINLGLLKIKSKK